MTAAEQRRDRGTGGQPCNCIDLTNAALAEHNTQLGLSFTWDRATGATQTYVSISTEVKERRRGARPISVLPSFCPFCGRPYEPIAAARADEAAAAGEGR